MPDLTTNNIFSLRDGGSTAGNAAFGTAVEVDGVRIGNNGSFGNMSGVDTRNITVADIAAYIYGICCRYITKKRNLQIIFSLLYSLYRKFSFLIGYGPQIGTFNEDRSTRQRGIYDTRSTGGKI